MLPLQSLQTTHHQAFSSPCDLHASRQGARCRTNRSAGRRPSSTVEIRSRLALRLKDTTANALLSLSLAAVLMLQQPSPALADSSTSMPPPSTASSTASQAASRTVIDVISGENSVLNEQNTPDNRQGSDQQQKDDKHNNPVGDTIEVGLNHDAVYGNHAQ